MSTPRLRPRQRGALLISFALMLVVVLGFVGLALDLSRLYNRKVELQNLADAAALAAAGQLNGTAAGVAAAAGQAAVVAAAHKIGYWSPVVWNAAALSFASTPFAPAGAWQSLAAAQAAPSGMLFARVDSSQLDAATGGVALTFMRALMPAAADPQLGASAVAGRASLKMTPLAVCAMGPATAQRLNPPATAELVEYGFRRGVGYNLLNLNPNATTPVYYYVNPLDPPGAAGAPANLAPAVLAPFVCSGTLALARIGGASISVAPGPAAFPLAAELNSRFDLNMGVNCQPSVAPPDKNIKAYTGSGAGWWMSVTPAGQTAAAKTGAASLATVADTAPPVAGVAATSYGPLWSYAGAVAWSAAPPYTALATTRWGALYPGVPAAPAAVSYPATRPYLANIGANFQAPNPSRPGLRNRRVLNIALLSCPVPAGANALAQVLAVGQFFMTAPASGAAVSGEFAGVVDEQTLGGPAELYQ
ncbi:pilus assembly protein TadG-related protein [Rugamonas rubra]|uniref:Putative Flp pilus-assembly TadE/G-like n=1 Tax=Rugamonas rubra TaxID=758825 RepID=A0A1I4K8P1_9BURK|nr:pilus assembly protein TadG-related protein [Rugamonas rubra]SFL75094.1 Putative Flp pilus-assembly TadE/G-like [Rugamonas rubra]